MYHKWKVLWLVVLLTAFGETFLAAEEKTPNVSGNKLPTEPGMGETITNWVDGAHARISKSILTTVHRLDTFFGDERIDEEKETTQIKLISIVKLSENQQPEFMFPMSLNLALPHLEHRVHIVVDTLLQQDPTLEEIPLADNTQKTNIKVSVRYVLLKKLREWVSLDGGVKVSGDRLALHSLDPFVALRLRGTTDFDPWALRLTHFVNWFENEGFGVTSRVDFERRIGQQMFFRMTSNAIWLEDEAGVQLSQTFFLRRLFSDKRALSLEISGAGDTSAPAAVEQYEVKLAYRRRLYKNWVFLTVEPGVQFLRTAHFKRALELLFNFEVQFGRSSD